MKNKKSNIWFKKNWKYIAEFILGIVLIPGAICLGVIFIPGPGTSDGWLGFWGGYLGSFIAIIFAFVNTKYQISEQKKNDLEALIETKEIEIKYEFIMTAAKTVKYIIGIKKRLQSIESIKGFAENEEVVFEFESVIDDFNIMWHVLLNVDPSVFDGIRPGLKNKKVKLTRRWENIKEARERINEKLNENATEDDLEEDIQLIKDTMKQMTQYLNSVRKYIAESINKGIIDD